MKSTLFIVFVLFSGILSSTLTAQQTIPTTGGDASSSSGSISYSIGQIGHTTTSSSSGSLAQGVQHAYEISVVSGVDSPQKIKLEISAYPNPTIDFLYLKIQNYNQSHLSYQLFDMSGKLIRKQDILYSETRISMESLATATYFIRVQENDIIIKTFKIIKR